MKTTPLLLLALSACAATPAPAPLPDGRLDGVYAGHRTNDAACGTQVEPIVFHVAGASISVHSRHRHRRLEGTVAADGHIALRDSTDLRHIDGIIQDGRLTATETVTGSGNSKHKKSSLDNPLEPSCLWRFDAVLVPPQEAVDF